MNLASVTWDQKKCHFNFGISLQFARKIQHLSHASYFQSSYFFLMLWERIKHLFSVIKDLFLFFCAHSRFPLCLKYSAPFHFPGEYNSISKLICQYIGRFLQTMLCRSLQHNTLCHIILQCFKIDIQAFFTCYIISFMYTVYVENRS